jgi:hypothetical protein
MSPYFDGYAARMRGESVSGNPFQRSDPWWWQWMEGWVDGASKTGASES